MSSAQPTPDDGVVDGDSKWYPETIGPQPTSGSVSVDGASIAYRVWGDSTSARANVVFVHGGAAQSAWWDHIAPRIASDRRVAALDLSGHGDSGRRDNYYLQTWAREILAVSEATAPGNRPILVAHSMGGASAVQVASVFPDRISGLILVDPLPHDVTSEQVRARTAEKFSKQRVYDTRSLAVERFRVLPEQRTDGAVLAHIAHNSVREVESGWSWKHDPAIYQVERGVPSDAEDIVCPVAVIHPEHGLSDKTGALVFGGPIPISRSVVVPGAAHHVMLDEPDAFLSCLREILADWP